MIAPPQVHSPRYSIRLAVGAALDFLLLVMLPQLAMMYAVVGAAALACVAPVLRRGTDVQRVGSVMVLSALAFWPAVGYWPRMGK